MWLPFSFLLSFGEGFRVDKSIDDKTSPAYSSQLVQHGNQFISVVYFCSRQSLAVIQAGFELTL